jgi:hypothetical protein
MERDPIARRDTGLRRVSRLTRLTMAGGLALTGVFSAVAARAFSGHSTAQAATTATTTPATESSSESSSASQSSSSASSTTTTTQLQSPSTAVRSSSGSSHVVSGGS